MVAILPTSLRDIPDQVTPEYMVRQFMVLEFGAVSELIDQWLAAASVAPQSLMRLSAIEAVKIVVAAGLGVSIVPEMVVARLDVIVRPLNPPLTRTLALIQHRSKHDDRALQIVRNALLELTNLPD